MTRGELTEFNEASSAIEHFQAGGLIGKALGPVSIGVDNLVQQHLASISQWDARGDVKPERPMYLLNPDNGLLMTYSRRRDAQQARSGLFAEVVTLDSAGKPTHGIDVVNPFDAHRVVPVAIADNEYGFTPSHLEIRPDGDEELIAPNIDIATIQRMLQAEPIDPDLPLNEFLKINEIEREKETRKNDEGIRNRYRGTQQGIDASTNPNLHLIISDRDSLTFAEISRRMGIFPVQVTIDQLIDNRRWANKYAAPEREFSLLSGYVPGTNNLATPTTPAFITYDYPFSSIWTPGQDSRTHIFIPQIGNVNKKNQRDIIAHETVRGIVNCNPVFAHLGNFGVNDSLDDMSKEDIEMTLEYDRPIQKRQHGRYEQIIRPYDEGSVEAYEKWLRKVYLDFALTKYFRGVNGL